MNRRRAIAIDCDPGLDDAVAIALAAASPSLAVDLVTTVEGNAPLDMVTANACSVMAALGLSAPVHQGHRALRPDPSRLSTANWGGDGSLELAPGLPPLQATRSPPSPAGSMSSPRGRASSSPSDRSATLPSCSPGVPASARRLPIW